MELIPYFPETKHTVTLSFDVHVKILREVSVPLTYGNVVVPEKCGLLFDNKALVTKPWNQKNLAVTLNACYHKSFT